MKEKSKTEDSNFSLYFCRAKTLLFGICELPFNFMSIIAGPCNNFKDYIAFIEGRHTHMKLLEVNWKEKGFHSLPELSHCKLFFSAKYLSRGLGSRACCQGWLSLLIVLIKKPNSLPESLAHNFFPLFKISTLVFICRSSHVGATGVYFTEKLIG